jgi:RNA polymerase sigma factor (sigma-70 family)
MSEALRVRGRAGEAGAHRAQAQTFEEFFHREKDGLYGALCLVTRNQHEAEELAQEAFVRVLERWDRVRSMDDPRAYLYRTAMNAFRSGYRRTLLAARRTVGAMPVDDEMAAVDELDATFRTLARLSTRQRAAVVLTDLFGFGSEDAARILGVRPSTLRMHVSRAHAALKEAMTRD